MIGDTELAWSRLTDMPGLRELAGVPSQLASVAGYDALDCWRAFGFVPFLGWPAQPADLAGGGPGESYKRQKRNERFQMEFC